LNKFGFIKFISFKLEIIVLYVLLYCDNEVYRIYFPLVIDLAEIDQGRQLTIWLLFDILPFKLT